MTLRFSLRIVSSLLAWSFAAMLAAPRLDADTVVLNNGDKMTGTAIKLEGGKLTFKTDYADAIVIAWKEVAKLTTSQPLILSSSKGSLSITSLERTPAGIIVSSASGPSTMDEASVTVLRSPADQKTYEESLHPNWGHGWAGAANVSLALTRGNSDTTAFGAGFTAARTTLTDKTALYANTIYDTNAHAVPTTSANATGGGVRYDHNLIPKLFFFGTGDFSTNELQDLNLRSIVGGGFGWHALESPRQTLDVMGGLVWTHESYSATTSAASTVNSFAALNLGQQYTRKMGASSLFTEQANFYPDMSDVGRYQFTINSAFSTKIGKIFNWVTSFNDSYTSFPPSGTVSNDAILTTGLGVSLARR